MGYNLKEFLNFDHRKGSNQPILIRSVITDMIASEKRSVITDPVKVAYLHVTTTTLRKETLGMTVFTNISSYSL